MTINLSVSHAPLWHKITKLIYTLVVQNLKHQRNLFPSKSISCYQIRITPGIHSVKFVAASLLSRQEHSYHRAFSDGQLRSPSGKCWEAQVQQNPGAY